MIHTGTDDDNNYWTDDNDAMEVQYAECSDRVGANDACNWELMYEGTHMYGTDNNDINRMI